MTAQFERQPGNVFVNVSPPTANHAANASRQDWKSIAHEMIAESTPPVSIPEAPKQISDNPVGDKMRVLIGEVDDRLNLPARINTAPGHDGHHYIESRSPAIDYDSPLRAWWRRVEQRKSDAVMETYKRQSAPVRPQKTEIALDTNAHGEILNMFGDVVEGGVA